jgi:hypothetical protein
MTTKKQNIFIYNSRTDGFSLTLDFIKNIWSLKITKATIFGLDGEPDGIDIYLGVGDYEGGIKLFPTQKTTLKI